jgi:hypothetical protein
MYSHNGNVPRRFLQQGVRNGARNVATSEFAMHAASAMTAATSGKVRP